MGGKYMLRGIALSEPPADYALHNNDGWWGPVTSSIDWCEHNYVVTPYVAEFFNATSNAIMVILGLLGALKAVRYGHERRFVVLYACLALVGVGSLAFHGTLTHVGQQGDETPMIFLSCAWLYVCAFMPPSGEAARRKAWTRGLVAFCAVFSVVHYVYRFVVSFQVSIAFFNLYQVWGILDLTQKSNDRAVKSVSHAYVFFLFAAFLLWNIDQHFCVSLYSLPHGVPNPQLHAWWHILVSVAAHCGAVALEFFRAERLRASSARGAPRIAWVGGVLPVCLLGDRMGAPAAEGGLKLRRSPRLARQKTAGR